ncbi:hypothetical protein BJX68DRAFT_222899 [Aspergillus pseudodeflectus]|uniref:Secreted protein n=1 Tax=Aspergillus pseudodeflectus TaxID=176178 RepID=A0ABR4LAZ5_9EURO
MAMQLESFRYFFVCSLSLVFWRLGSHSSLLRPSLSVSFSFFQLSQPPLAKLGLLFCDSEYSPTLHFTTLT